MKPRHLSRLALLAAALAACPSPAGAQAPARTDSADCTPRQAAEHHCLFRNTANSWFANPALQHEAYATDYARLYLHAGTRRERESFVMQEGRMESHAGLSASSYRDITPKARRAGAPGSKVWGEASYRQGRRGQVEWNASADWSAVFPYVLADTLGGDRHTERYAFRGGCATRWGRWTVGEELTFRAEHEWSTRDPRMRAIVTDLRGGAGLSRSMKGHHLALGATLRLYKQTNSVEFYREEGVIPEYQMSGLGNWYERFSGTNNKAYYKATGYGLNLGLRPEAGRGGLLLAADCETTPYRRILSILNALPIQRLRTTRWNARLGWTAARKASSIALWLGTDGERRRGEEIIAGESVADEFVVRGYLPMYARRFTGVHLGAMASRTLGSAHRLTLRLEGGRQLHRASYAFPHSRLDYAKNGLGATLQWQTSGRRWLLVADLEAMHLHTTSATFEASRNDGAYTSPLKDDVAAAKRRMTERCVAQETASHTRIALGLHAAWHPSFMGGRGLFAEAKAAYRRNDAEGGNPGYALHAALGITF